MSKHSFKYLLAAIPIFFVVLIHIQGRFNRPKLAGLNAVSAAPNPYISLKGWFDGTYQEDESRYINDGFGYRSSFLRLARQYDFSLFHQMMKSSDVVVGKGNYLFGKNYIASYNTLIGDVESQLQGKAQYFNTIAAGLAQCNKTMITVLAPNKVGFFSEFLPDFALAKNRINSNEVFALEGKRIGQSTLDFHSIFMENKGKTRFPLFTQLGTHWSIASITELVTDSLLQRIATQRHIAKPSIEITEANTKEKCFSGDCDYEWMANLMFPIKEFPLSYPSAVVHNTQDTKKLDVLLIGDSFYGGIQDANIFKDIFKSTNFIWYNEYIRNDATKQESSYKDINFSKIIDTTEVFIFLASPTNVGVMGWKTEHRLADYLESKGVVKFPAITEDPSHSVVLPDYLIDKKIPQVELEKYKESMRKTPSWLNDLKLTARELNVPLEYILQRDALYLYRQEH